MQTVEPFTPQEIPADWILFEQHDDHHWSFVETRHVPDSSVEKVRGFFGGLAGEECQSLALRDIYLVLAKEKKRRRRKSRSAA